MTMSDPPSTIRDMADVVDLERWRLRREPGGRDAGPRARLTSAVERLETVLARLGWNREAPGWVVTELLAIQGAMSLGMVDEAAGRAESLAARSERRRAGRG